MSSRGVDSARKGAAFERKVARDLSLWASRGKDAHVFNRRSASGGASRDKGGHSGHGGDIFAEKSSGKWLTDRFCFELKFYADLTGEFWNFACGDGSKRIDAFIRQAWESATVYERFFFLILKCNRRAPIVMTDVSELFLKACGIKSLSLTMYDTQERLFPGITCFSFSQWFQTKPGNVKKQIKEYSEPF